jgi:hypothetical protein
MVTKTALVMAALKSFMFFRFTFSRCNINCAALHTMRGYDSLIAKAPSRLGPK